MTFYDAVNDVSRGERAVVVVPERVGEGTRRSTEARLEEAKGLDWRHRPGRGGAEGFPCPAGQAGDLSRQGAGG